MKNHCVIYCRASSAQQIEKQQQSAIDFANQSEMQVSAIYKDLNG